MDPDQTAPVLIWVYTVKKASITFQQKTKADDFCCDCCFKIYYFVPFWARYLPIMTTASSSAEDQSRRLGALRLLFCSIFGRGIYL